MSHPPLNVAIVGSGIAGLSAAWLLSERHRVTVFEQDSRIGGHSHTVSAPGRDGSIPVDTGFIVYNERNYPNLTALFAYLQVPTKDSDMSFAASLQDGRFEYSGTDLNGVFGQRRNLVRPRFWTMLRDIRRFYREAPLLLEQGGEASQSLGDYLHANRYSVSFIDDHLLPMGAAIWSAKAQEMLDFPAAAFIRFFDSHGLLQIADRPVWCTVDGGSREYVKRLTASYRDRIETGCAVQSIRREAGRVWIGDSNGQRRAFDHVVIVAHADQALRLLDDPDPQEASLLGAIRYSSNRALLHSDPCLMPRRRRVWSSWNYLQADDEVPGAPLCVTYWMNRLQGIPDSNPLFVTLNPHIEPAAGTLLGEYTYEHPQFDRNAMQAQVQLGALHGVRNTWYCGSYFGYGFHEDALQSGLAAVEALGGVRRPWSVANESGRIAIPQVLPVAA